MCGTGFFLSLVKEVWPGREEVWGRKDACVSTAESPRCSPGTTTLLSNQHILFYLNTK